MRSTVPDEVIAHCCQGSLQGNRLHLWLDWLLLLTFIDDDHPIIFFHLINSQRNQYRLPFILRRSYVFHILDKERFWNRRCSADDLNSIRSTSTRGRTGASTSASASRRRSARGSTITQEVPGNLAGMAGMLSQAPPTKMVSSAATPTLLTIVVVGKTKLPVVRQIHSLPAQIPDLSKLKLLASTLATFPIRIEKILPLTPIRHLPTPFANAYSFLSPAAFLLSLLPRLPRLPTKLTHTNNSSAHEPTTLPTFVKSSSSATLHSPVSVTHHAALAAVGESRPTRPPVPGW